MVSTGVAQACVEMRTLRSSTHYLDQRRADSIMARSIAPQTGRIHLRRPTPLTPEDSACNLAADHTISTPPPRRRRVNLSVDCATLTILLVQNVGQVRFRVSRANARGRVSHAAAAASNLTEPAP
jgi:hypothetical protein